mmetsp:Transcript_7714/g.17856  ORF Transcript_7714/g.17856 Transcript_7714/m.17856 type:complete len:245 (+) Transcript_7714:1080-1814(+)
MAAATNGTRVPPPTSSRVVRVGLPAAAMVRVTKSLILAIIGAASASYVARCIFITKSQSSARLSMFTTASAVVDRSCLSFWHCLRMRTIPLVLVQVSGPCLAWASAMKCAISTSSRSDAPTSSVSLAKIVAPSGVHRTMVAEEKYEPTSTRHTSRSSSALRSLLWRTPYVCASAAPVVTRPNTSKPATLAASRTALCCSALKHAGMAKTDFRPGPKERAALATMTEINAAEIPMRLISLSSDPY